jgi:uncharacterized repeat protein (TIGR01451 family)
MDTPLQDPENEPSALDSMEQKLYDPKGTIENLSMHHVRDRKEKELPTSWGENTPIIREAEDSSGVSFGTKFLIGAVVLLIFVLAFTAWRVLSSRNVVSEKNIDMTLDITPYVEGGEPTPLTVSIQNRNQVALEEASLTLMYKEGSGAQDEEEKIQVKKDLGTIASTELIKQDFDVRLFGSEAESRDITVKLEYMVKGSNAKFSKVAVTQVVLKSPPIAVKIDGPNLISAGQVGTYTFTVTNTTGTTSEPALLKATLPTNFQVESSSPKPTYRGYIWRIPALAAGGTSTITLSGTLSGNQGETATIKTAVGSVSGSVSEIGVVYSSQTFDIKLRTSPLTFTTTFDTERGGGESLRYGDKVLLGIHYKNGSQSPLSDMEITLKIGGDAAVIKQISADRGYYDSTNGTITWNKATMPELATVAAGAEGTLLINIPIVTKGTNSPKLALTITGKATASEPNDVVATLSKTYVVQGSASLSGSTHYKNSPFQNSGPIPPQPNVDTTYSEHLIVSAQNALQNARVSFTLPAYVTWRNVTSDSAKVTYDSKTRTVTWNVGSLDAGKSTAVDIGLSVRPSQVHVNSSPNVTSAIILDADEAVSRAHLQITISALTTYIAGESWNVDPSVVVDR